MQDESGQILETHSVSAGLDYPGVGPEHAWLKDTGRAEYVVADDDEALEAFKELTKVEFESNNTLRANLGFRLQMAILALQANYTFSKYPVATIGAGISIR